MKNLHLLTLLFFLFSACKEAPKATTDTAITQEVDKPAVDTSYAGQALNRFEAAILAFEEEDSRRLPQEREVLFTGSSSIRFWETLAEDFAPVPVLNRGFGGSTLPEVIHYADRIIFSYAPETIVLYCGENDIAAGARATQVFKSFQTLDELIEERLPETKLIYIAMKPSPSRWSLWPTYKKGDRMIRRYIESKENRYFVDCSPMMLLPSGEPDSSIFVEDMLHMNAKGYDRWEAIIEPVVVEVRGRSEEVEASDQH